MISLSDRANLLIRTNINKPLKAITSDISDIYYKQGIKKCYLCVHKDVFGQMVYGYEIKQTKDVKLVLSSFEKCIKNIRKLIKNRILKKMLFHQDQGSQYTSYDYVDKVLKNQMRLSYSTIGTPTDNPGQESFFGRFKDDWKSEILELNEFGEVKRFIKNKIRYYNHRRLHTSIDNQTPYKFTKNFIKNISLSKDKKWFRIFRG